MGHRIRAAVDTDAGDLGAVHVRAWEAAYRGGLMPDEYLDVATLCGPEGQVRERLEIYKEVGVTYLNIDPQGDDRLGTVEKIKAWVE